MASEVKTNKISPATGTDVTLGDTSDTFTVPSGSAIAVASGGDINVLSGGEIDIASGATLDVNGTIDLTGATTTGFPAGGLTTASQWRLTADFTNAAAPITTNLEEVDAPVGFGVLGSSMTQSSGIFTFPSTGYWLITYHALFLSATTSNYNYLAIQTCIDHTAGPTFADACLGSGAYQGNQIAGHTISYIFDVTNTTECKCQFIIGPLENTSSSTTRGDSNFNETSMTFTKLADT